MTRVTATEFKNNVGAFSDAAMREPVIITSHQRDRLVLISAYENDLVRIYKYSARKWGRSVAERTLKQIAEVEQWTYLSGRSRIRSSALCLLNWNRVSARRSTKLPKTRNEQIWTSVRCRDNPAIGCGLVDGVSFMFWTRPA